MRTWFFFGVLLTCAPECGGLNSVRVVSAKDVLPNFPFGVELGFFFFFVFLFFLFFLFFVFCTDFRNIRLFVMSRWNNYWFW